jgi:mono/diheme cytochrome c family protein
MVARGEYLTRAADCVSCHTAPGGKPFGRDGKHLYPAFPYASLPEHEPHRRRGIAQGRQNVAAKMISIEERQRRVEC